MVDVSCGRDDHAGGSPVAGTVGLSWPANAASSSRQRRSRTSASLSIRPITGIARPRKFPASFSRRPPNPRFPSVGCTTSAVLGRELAGCAPLPIWLWTGCRVTLPAIAPPKLRVPAADVRRRPRSPWPAGQETQGRKFLCQPVGIVVKAQDGLQGGDGELAEPHRPLHGIALDPGDEVCAPGHDPGLRPAQELVAAERDEVRARREGFAGRGLMGQVPARQVHERAAAEIDDEGKVARVGKFREVPSGNFGGEPFDDVVAGMYLHDQSRFLSDRVGIVVKVCPVRRADLAQPASRAGHDVGHAE